jgi:RNA polymerase sigma factor (sigma-70 family)
MEGRPSQEHELVLRAQRGDRHAFEMLVRTHWEVAFRLAYVITRDAADAEEATQDAFLKSWRALGRFRRSRPLRPWLLRIVANEARNRRRSTGRRAGLALRAQAAHLSGDAAPSPEDLAVARDERARLLGELEGLPEESQMVLVCRYLLDLSEEETAAALGLRRGTVKSRTSRALDRLREIHG